MYIALSTLPQHLLGESFSSYVQRTIFEPLGMKSATYFPVKAAKSGYLAQGFGRDGVNGSEDIFGMGTPRAMPFPWSDDRCM
jgi:CubicO group peptidase (beta-lactamase class C family)